MRLDTREEDIQSIQYQNTSTIVDKVKEKDGINNQKINYSTRKTYQEHQSIKNKPITKPPINWHDHKDRNKCMCCYNTL